MKIRTLSDKVEGKPRLTRESSKITELIQEFPIFPQKPLFHLTLCLHYPYPYFTLLLPYPTLPLAWFRDKIQSYNNNNFSYSYMINIIRKLNVTQKCVCLCVCMCVHACVCVCVWCIDAFFSSYNNSKKVAPTPIASKCCTDIWKRFVKKPIDFGDDPPKIVVCR